MEVNIQPGLYVIAVSGGVDSMALLSTLRRYPGVELIVAHYDHGIRLDSAEDKHLVQDVAREYGLRFVYDEGRLGPDVSEEAARIARYDFLHHVRKVSDAKGIITAHHQDDLLETAVHNMLRGTGRRGLVSLRSRDYIHRPLLHIPKADLVAYAKGHGLRWREDSTNSDLRFRRNYIRHKILSQLSSAQKKELLQHIRDIHNKHDELEEQLTNYLHLQPAADVLDRHRFVMLPHVVAREVLAAWLRNHTITNLGSGMVERLTVAAKTYTIGKQADITKQHVLVVEKDVLAIRRRDR